MHNIQLSILANTQEEADSIQLACLRASMRVQVILVHDDENLTTGLKSIKGDHVLFLEPGRLLIDDSLTKIIQHLRKEPEQIIVRDEGVVAPMFKLEMLAEYGLKQTTLRRLLRLLVTQQGLQYQYAKSDPFLHSYVKYFNEGCLKFPARLKIVPYRLGRITAHFKSIISFRTGLSIKRRKLAEILYEIVYIQTVIVEFRSLIKNHGLIAEAMERSRPRPNPDEYSKLTHNNPGHHEIFAVNWVLLSVCNFKCSYCIPALHDGKFRGADITVIKAFLEKIFVMKADKKIYIEFTGGEVTYYKHFKELMSYIKESGGDSGLISNGSRDMEFWKEHRHLLDHVCLSFHPEEGNPEKFLEVVKYLNETCTVHVNIMLHPDPQKFSEAYDLAKKVVTNVKGITIALQALLENMQEAMYQYNEEQLQILQEQRLPLPPYEYTAFEKNEKVFKTYRGQMVKMKGGLKGEVLNSSKLVTRGENNWQGWECHAGLENIAVDLEGNVYRGWCLAGGPLGRIDDPDFTLPTKPVICPLKICGCHFDVMSTKVRLGN